MQKIVLKLHCETKVRQNSKNMFQLGCCLTRRPLVSSQLPVANIVFIANPLYSMCLCILRNKINLFCTATERSTGRLFLPITIRCCQYSTSLACDVTEILRRSAIIIKFGSIRMCKATPDPPSPNQHNCSKSITITYTRDAKSFKLLFCW